MAHIAHVKGEPDGTWTEHLLADHLKAVAELARGFGVVMGMDELAYIAGLWHDLGKYSPAFQERIRLKSGYDVNAHLEGKTAQSVDHSTAGGVHAVKCLGNIGQILAFPILGHHTGLQNRVDVERRLVAYRTDKSRVDELLPLIPGEIGDASIAAKPRAAEPTLFIRMLFSCLVDADFLDTEAFFDPQRAKDRGQSRSLTELLESLNAHLHSLEQSCRATPLNSLRKTIREHIDRRAADPPGFFTLTVPTGGGKTLGSLSFALRHALHHGQQRIIYAIPYTSIVEQTADVFRRALGSDAVLEHHSNIDPTAPQRETQYTRLLAENWQANLIVTTTVQLFESLFSRRTSRCRKLHNIANSIIILDEAQLLPPDYLAPVLKVLEELTKNYGATVVLCTATQPALENVVTRNYRFEGVPGARELAPDPLRLHEELRRVEVHSDTFGGEAGGGWPAIAKRIEAYETVLTVVNTRRDARELFELLPHGALHLSTSLCGQHRSDILARVRVMLQGGTPVRLVSTQLIEAGVDIDFPVVFRALTGLDSIAQAAGRCNREGLRDRGKVFVFQPPRSSPPGHLRQMELAGRHVLTKAQDPLSPGAYREYFRDLFWAKGDALDRKRILEMMQSLRFEDIHAAFRIIEDDTVPLLVPYGDGPRLAAEASRGLSRDLLRRAQRFVVNVRARDLQRLVRESCALLYEDTLAVLTNSRLYHPDLGLVLEQTGGYDPEELII